MKLLHGGHDDFSVSLVSVIGRPNSLATFFLNVDDDVGFFQLFLQPLILAAQLFIFASQRIALRLRTPSLREGFVEGRIALFPPAVQRRGIDSLAAQDHTNPTAVGQRTVGFF